MDIYLFIMQATATVSKYIEIMYRLTDQITYKNMKAINKSSAEQ